MITNGIYGTEETNVNRKIISPIIPTPAEFGDVSSEESNCCNGDV
jgi:hypothetical protein